MVALADDEIRDRDDNLVAQGSGIFGFSRPW